MVLLKFYIDFSALLLLFLHIWFFLLLTFSAFFFNSINLFNLFKWNSTPTRPIVFLFVLLFHLNEIIVQTTAEWYQRYELLSLMEDAMSGLARETIQSSIYSWRYELIQYIEIWIINVK